MLIETILEEAEEKIERKTGEISTKYKTEKVGMADRKKNAEKGKEKEKNSKRKKGDREKR